MLTILRTLCGSLRREARGQVPGLPPVVDRHVDLHEVAARGVADQAVATGDAVAAARPAVAAHRGRLVMPDRLDRHARYALAVIQDAAVDRDGGVLLRRRVRDGGTDLVVRPGRRARGRRWACRWRRTRTGTRRRTGRGRRLRAGLRGEGHG